MPRTANAKVQAAADEVERLTSEYKRNAAQQTQLFAALQEAHLRFVNAVESRSGRRILEPD